MGDFQDISGQDAAAILGSSLGDRNGEFSDEEARALGYESAEAAIEAFN
jgi:hypothetical protein